MIELIMGWDLLSPLGQMNGLMGSCLPGPLGQSDWVLGRGRRVFRNIRCVSKRTPGCTPLQVKYCVKNSCFTERSISIYIYI